MRVGPSLTIVEEEEEDPEPPNASTNPVDAGRHSGRIGTCGGVIGDGGSKGGGGEDGGGGGNGGGWRWWYWGGAKAAQEEEAVVVVEKEEVKGVPCKVLQSPPPTKRRYQSSALQDNTARLIYTFWSSCRSQRVARRTKDSHPCKNLCKPILHVCQSQPELQMYRHAQVQKLASRPGLNYVHKACRAHMYP